LEEAIQDLNSASLEPPGQGEDWRHLVPLQRRIRAAIVAFDTLEYTTLRMTFWRKVWDSDGTFIGMEDIVRRQPYEALQSPM